jgi:hypothetical protein
MPRRPSAAPRFFRRGEPDQGGNDLMRDDHIIFWNILEWVYGHDSRGNGLLVKPGQHQYCWRMIEHRLEPAELMRLTSTKEERICEFASSIKSNDEPG